MSSSHTKPEVALGSQWRNRKSGIIGTVIEIRHGSAYLKREKRPSSWKWIRHLLVEYELVVTDPAQAEEAAIVGRAMARFQKRLDDIRAGTAQPLPWLAEHLADLERAFQSHVSDDEVSQS